MGTVNGLSNSCKGKNFIIIGAGGTLSIYKDKVNKLIESEGLISIGINNMVGVCNPTYHLWTNTKRYLNFGVNISSKSIPIFSYKFSDKLIRKHWDGDFIKVFYTDKKGTNISVSKKFINGYFRTAGCLAIMISSIWGANNIYIAGMDGYTYINSDDKVKGQHLYGEGMTDSSDWNLEKNKDDIVYRVLKSISNYGVDFKIITPTVFKDFYDADILGRD